MRHVTSYNIDTNFGGISAFSWLVGLSRREGLCDKTDGEQNAIYNPSVFKPVINY